MKDDKEKDDLPNAVVEEKKLLKWIFIILSFMFMITGFFDLAKALKADKWVDVVLYILVTFGWLSIAIELYECELIKIKVLPKDKSNEN